MSAEHKPGDQPIPDPDQTENDAAAQQQPQAPVEEDPIAALQAQLAAVQAEAKDNYDAMLRARAEADNVRRRAQEEVAKAQKFGIESFAESLLPVKDSLEAALAQENQSLETLREGVDVTLKQLTGAFERNKLVEIAPVPGDKFNPHHHQAIASVPSDEPANTVLQTLQKGYMIVDRVLRPALVTVAGPK
ncbi:nucleotide exchange factor GrpE [Pigmentiphaga sp. NML080357]|uniref:nucleotide exchange factor GrpE n=1 Tax=Pigmentiphaga sp. NML080357 TaxID=2008675 RepID=UPI000B410455|nr:nucleotide exchange factor GrpE [Pigmentiphaga sp. NML080357]OVZ58017.1 nucleotide exchange factor GrpE [Pigmentiphaga sp. NML080357]